MLEKRFSPLNNPLLQKSTNNQVNSVSVVVKRDVGVSKGGEGKTRLTTEEMLAEYREMTLANQGQIITIYMLLRCRQCGSVQQITFAYWKPPKWHRCVGCKELQPTQGFAMMGHSNSHWPLCVE